MTWVDRVVQQQNHFWYQILSLCDNPRYVQVLQAIALSCKGIIFFSNFRFQNASYSLLILSSSLTNLSLNMKPKLPWNKVTCFFNSKTLSFCQRNHFFSLFPIGLCGIYIYNEIKALPKKIFVIKTRHVKRKLP